MNKKKKKKDKNKRHTEVNAPISKDLMNTVLIKTEIPIPKGSLAAKTKGVLAVTIDVLGRRRHLNQHW